MEERKETGGEEKEGKKERKRLGYGKSPVLPQSGTGQIRAGPKCTEPSRKTDNDYEKKTLK